MVIEAEDLQFVRRDGSFSLTLPSFSMAAGEAMAVLGSSGSGKSTLLDLIGGVLRPTAGRLSLFGQDATGLSSTALDRLRGDRMGVIFQEHNLLPFATGRQNVALGVRFSAARRARLTGPVDAEIERLLTLMGLEPAAVLHRHASDLSVGQRQRVAAARALLGAPDLIIADEPTSALDEGNQARFMALLNAARQETGAALLFVTHDPRLVEGFDQVLRLDDPDETRGPDQSQGEDA